MLYYEFRVRNRAELIIIYKLQKENNEFLVTNLNFLESFYNRDYRIYVSGLRK